MERTHRRKSIPLERKIVRDMSIGERNLVGREHVEERRCIHKLAPFLHRSHLL